MSEHEHTRSGIPLDTLPTAPTLREAAQAVVDRWQGWWDEDPECLICMDMAALRDALAATSEPALSDGLLHDVLLNLFADSKYGECPDPVGDIINTLRRYGFVITRIGGA